MKAQVNETSLMSRLMTVIATYTQYGTSCWLTLSVLGRNFVVCLKSLQTVSA